MAHEISCGSDSRSESHTRRGHAVAARAAAQHGVVSRAQLVAMGFGERAIDNRIARCLLHPIHRGVYAVGHTRLRREAWRIAAVLAGGPGTVLGFRSAAALWCVRRTTRSAVEVVTPHVLRRPGIHAHRIVPAHDEVTVEDGIPVTAPARTLFDLAAVVTPDQLEHAFDEAEYRRLTSPTSLAALLERYPRHTGNAAVARVLEKQRRYGETRTRSELERGFLSALVTAGWRVVRITARQLETDPDTIAAQLSGLLGATPSPRSARRARRPPLPRPATRSAAP